MSTPYLGSIMLASFQFAPKGWAFCNGQLLSIQQNAALFALLGTTYGGNGTTTFALPDLRGRVPVHVGSGFVLGELTGSQTATLNAAQLPAHIHPVACNTSANPTGSQLSPSGNFPAAVHQNQFGVYSTASTTQMSPGMIQGGGSNQPFTIIQPYLCVNFVIALQGIFPSQN